MVLWLSMFGCRVLVPDCYSCLGLLTVWTHKFFLLSRVSEDIRIELTALVGVAVSHFWADDGHNHETDPAFCLF